MFGTVIHYKLELVKEKSSGTTYKPYIIQSPVEISEDMAEIVVVLDDMESCYIRSIPNFFDSRLFDGFMGKDDVDLVICVKDVKQITDQDIFHLEKVIPIFDHTFGKADLCSSLRYLYAMMKEYLAKGKLHLYEEIMDEMKSSYLEAQKELYFLLKAMEKMVLDQVDCLSIDFHTQCLNLLDELKTTS